MLFFAYVLRVNAENVEAGCVDDLSESFYEVIMLSDIFFKHSDELRPKSVIDELFSDSERGIDILFLSGEHDLREVMYELDARGLHHVIGCTTAGHISSEGYKTQGGLRFHLGGSRLKSRSWMLDLDLSDLLSKGSELRQFAAANPDAFGIIMIDGLSGREESIVGALRRELPGVPIVGGSAGDSLKFEKTHLFHGAELHSDVAILTLVATADFRVSMFRLQHHLPTEKAFLVTRAEGRRLYELNGRPALEVYLEATGLSESELGASAYGRYPLMAKSGEHFYIRAIHDATHEGLDFFCKLEVGTVLRLGTSPGSNDELLRTLDGVGCDGPHVSLFFDCTLRRLEFEDRALSQLVGRRLGNSGSGFCTYGEQLDGIHVNQTLVGLRFEEP